MSELSYTNKDGLNLAAGFEHTFNIKNTDELDFFGNDNTFNIKKDGEAAVVEETVASLAAFMEGLDENQQTVTVPLEGNIAVILVQDYPDVCNNPDSTFGDAFDAWRGDFQQYADLKIVATLEDGTEKEIPLANCTLVPSRDTLLTDIEGYEEFNVINCQIVYGGQSAGFYLRKDFVGNIKPEGGM